MSEREARPGGLVQELAERNDQPGASVVDDVLASLRSLADRPVHEHVAVFEQAHERLRRALDPRHG